MEYDKILGMLVGLALGDALGAPHELRGTKKSKYTGKLEHRNNYLPRFKKAIERIYYSVGQCTDDTQKSLNIARSLAKYGRYNRNDILMRHLNWAAHPNIRGMGVLTKELLAPTTKGKPINIEQYEVRMTKMLDECNKKGTERLSNGALMSCAVLALLPDESRIETVIEDCSITNPFDICIDANIVYVESIRSALLGKSIDDIVLSIPASTTEVYDTLVKATENNIINVDGKDKGYVLYPLWCSYFSLIWFDNYKDAIDFIINLKGDTDTNACIAGALLGAYFGYNKLYECEGDNIDILLSCDTSDSDLPLPSEWRVNDLKELAETLYNKFK